MTYTIEYDPTLCICCKKCAEAAPTLWEMEPGGKAILKGSQKSGSIFKVDISDSDLESHKKAANACGMKVIHILDKGTMRHIL